ncbi:conjugal transfer protein TraF [Glaesserella parasuis]|nr:conjugal transfer protein TrbB [Glaesserella parasuis 174]MCT8756559.1 conjugal transfer protein TraF [Glaesserella parasuis]MDD2170374.1 conjugal transfer protein TraF [Glaesserella parasuis]MDO9767938.1 conjugal transfer protein TraF [Glaesserella parasuis]MDO9922513.1 conjugal transfer protein TraF [Glaesserella parasuis]
MKKLIMPMIFCLSMVVNANPALEMIEALDQKKQINVQQNTPPNQEQVRSQPKVQKRLITLSNGKKMDISDWRIVHFMSSTCSYCRSFNPKLKQISEQTGIPVITYSFDGLGDEHFPMVFDANEDVLREFFAEIPRATPTNFIINVNTLVTLPLTQGDTSHYAFLQRLDEVFLYVDQNLKEMVK